MPPQARLIVQTVKDVTLVTVTEPSIIDARLIEGIKGELFELVDKQNRRKLVLDMTKVQYLSSSALGLLIPVHEKTQKLKGLLVLCGVNPKIKKVFKITKLDKLFTFAETEGDALAQFGVSITA